MKKRIIVFCLLIVIFTIAANATRRRIPRPGVRRYDTIRKLREENKNLQQMIMLKEKTIELLTLEIKRLTLIIKNSNVNPLLLNLQRIQSPLKIGQIVFFDEDDNLKVLQIADKHTLLAELRIKKLIGDDWVNASETVLVTNISTSGLVDDKVIQYSPDTFFAITQTKTYETVMGGSKTVFVLERFSESDLTGKSKSLTL